MKFGTVPVREAVGALAAHSLRAGPVHLRKGRLITPDLAAALEGAGVTEVVAARLEDGDVGEDEAAGALAEVVAGSGTRAEAPFTGRSNLFATNAGVFLVSESLVDAINAVDEAVTLATLPDFKPVVEGEMVATVKIIPYAVSGNMLRRAMDECQDGPAVSVVPYRLKRVGVISTLTPGLKPTIVTKTVDVLRERLKPAGAEVVRQASCRHEPDELARELAAASENGAELTVVFGASAIADRRDVIPAAIEAAGGRIEHFGMPVDPGNLLLIGEIAGKPVIGAPGCARSPKENGFDWVLHRLLAGLDVRSRDVTKLGVGGLLMEIVSRGQPREGGEPAEEG